MVYFLFSKNHNNNFKLKSKILIKKILKECKIKNKNYYKFLEMHNNTIKDKLNQYHLLQHHKYKKVTDN